MKTLADVIVELRGADPSLQGEELHKTALSQFEALERAIEPEFVREKEREERIRELKAWEHEEKLKALAPPNAHQTDPPSKLRKSRPPIPMKSLANVILDLKAADPSWHGEGLLKAALIQFAALERAREREFEMKCREHEREIEVKRWEHEEKMKARAPPNPPKPTHRRNYVKSRPQIPQPPRYSLFHFLIGSFLSWNGGSSYYPISTSSLSSSTTTLIATSHRL
ncbi:hypothetical protein HK104_000176 [Borealophlyctis nickersoniae]|nr:hypothetical protein HK104_000176 [Borealophlyctis nickersoniae]